MQKLAKQYSGKPDRVLWARDGIEGGPSSEDVVVQWYSTWDNYVHWKGSDGAKGESKNSLAREILLEIQSAGIKTPREVKDVVSKINHLEQSYKAAVDWTGKTGNGVMDETTVRQAILKKCPHYDLLHTVLADHPSVKPLLTNLDPNYKDSSQDSDTDDDDDGDFLPRPAEEDVESGSKNEDPSIRNGCDATVVDELYASPQEEDDKDLPLLPSLPDTQNGKLLCAFSFLSPHLAAIPCSASTDSLAVSQSASTAASDRFQKKGAKHISIFGQEAEDAIQSNGVED